MFILKETIDKKIYRTYKGLKSVDAVNAKIESIIDGAIGQSHFEIFKVEEDGSEKFILGRMALTVGTWRLGNND